MADTLTLAELVARTEQLTNTTALAFGHWAAARKVQLLNDAAYEVFKLLIETFEEGYFVEVADGIQPAGKTISLASLTPPFYRMCAFQRCLGQTWVDVKILTPREAWRTRNGYPDVWYRVGDALKTEGEGSGTYRIMYHYRLPKMEQDGDVCQIPPEYVEMVPLHAAMLASIQSKAKDDYNHFRAEWERRKDEMRKSAANRMLNRDFRVIDLQGYDDLREHGPYTSAIV